MECCRGPDRILWLDTVPEDLSLYQVEYRNGRPYLAMQPNDDCVYLTEQGCGIYQWRPNICRTYDCRDYIDKPIPLRIRLEALKRATFT